MLSGGGALRSPRREDEEIDLGQAHQPVQRFEGVL